MAGGFPVENTDFNMFSWGVSDVERREQQWERPCGASRVRQGAGGRGQGPVQSKVLCRPRARCWLPVPHECGARVADGSKETGPRYCLDGAQRVAAYLSSVRSLLTAGVSG